jgi:DNA-binding GntR family transcriptional regulator
MQLSHPKGESLSLNLPRMEPAETIAGRLYVELEEAIIDGRLLPGQRIHADEIAEHFQVSRIPVREALRALNANGWLEIRPRRESLVPRQTPEDLRDLFEVRTVVDAWAAELAAERRTDADLAALEALIDESRSAGDDMTALAKLNERFHVAVGHASANALLEGLTQSLAKRVRWYFAQLDPSRGADSVKEHSELFEAIKARHAARAAELASAHSNRTRQTAITAMNGRE